MAQGGILNIELQYDIWILLLEQELWCHSRERVADIESTEQIEQCCECGEDVGTRSFGSAAQPN
jgi:hypothetical protein